MVLVRTALRAGHGDVDTTLCVPQIGLRFPRAAQTPHPALASDALPLLICFRHFAEPSSPRIYPSLGEFILYRLDTLQRRSPVRLPMRCPAHGALV